MGNHTQTLADILSGSIQPFRSQLNASRILAGIALGVLIIGWILHEMYSNPGINPVSLRLVLVAAFSAFLLGTRLSKHVRTHTQRYFSFLLVLLNIWIIYLVLINGFRIQFLPGLVFTVMITSAVFQNFRYLTVYIGCFTLFLVPGAALAPQTATNQFIFITVVLIVFIGIYLILYLRSFTNERFGLRTEIFSSIFNDSDAALLLLNPETGDIEYVNSKTHHLFQLPDTYFSNGPVPFSQLVPVPLNSEASNQFYEVRLSTLDGQLFWGDISVKPFQTSNTRFILVRIMDATLRKGAEEAAERMTAQRRRLLDIARSLLNTLSLDDVFNTITDALSTVVRYNLIVLYWQEPGSKILRPLASKAIDWNGYDPDQFVIPEGQGIAGRVVVTDEIVMINNSHLDPESFYPPGYDPGDEHIIAIPVKVSGKNIAAFSVIRTGPIPFSPDDFELIQLLVTHSISAIQNSVLHEEFRRRARHSESLVQVTKAINSTMQQEELLDLIVEKVLELIEAKHGALFLSDPINGHLSVGASRGIDPAILPLLNFGPGDSIAGWVAQTGRGVMIHDVDKHPRFQVVDKREVFTSMISIPLKIKDKVVGVLGVDRMAGEKYFTEREFNIACDFAEQAALAMENSRLFNQIEVSEKKYRSLFEEIDDAVFIASPGGLILDINPAGYHMFGYSSAADMFQVNIWEDLCIDKANQDLFLKNLSRIGNVKNFEITMKKKDGTPITVLHSSNLVKNPDGAVVYLHGTIKDITEQRRFQQQLFQSQKMESIGQLAGGMAHDFNNILSGIMGYASFIRNQMDPDHPQFRYVSAIEQAANRAADLISQLLAFARGTSANKIPSQVNKIISDTLHIIERTFEKQVTIRTQFDPELPLIMGDPVQLQQVFLNLCVNARDAVRGKGTIVITTFRKTIFADPDIPEVTPGEYVIITVTDNGMGMTEDVRKRIFEPFFTTKEVGKGTGLGLAMAYGVVKGHSGFIQVRSAPGEGSTFSVYLPAHVADVSDLTVPADSHAPAEQSVPDGSGASILVVDDDPSIRGLISDILTHYHYHILHAGNGLEAIQMMDIHGSRIRLIILDIMMPQMNGVEGYYEIIQKFPDVKVIFSSGYSQTDLLDGILKEKSVRFLPKPYHVKDLLDMVNSMMEPHS